MVHVDTASRRNVGALLAFLLLVSPATGWAAQESTPASFASVTVGSRVRVVSTAIGARRAGVVVAIDDSVLTLAPDEGNLLKLPLGSISGIDLSAGRRRNTLWGFGIGALSGAALGLAFDVDPENCGPETVNFCSRGEAVVAPLIVFGAAGAVIGTFIKSQRWKPIRLGVRPSGTATRQVPALEIAMAVRF